MVNPLAARMLSLGSSLSSLRAAGTKGCRACSLSSVAVTGPIPLTNEVGVWDPSDCDTPGRKLLLVDKSQLFGYLLLSANSPLVWDASIQ